VRQRELAEKQLIARSALDTLKAQRDAAEARVRQMQSDIGDRQVRAVCRRRRHSPGQPRLAGDGGSTIATLDDISRVYVDFRVPRPSWPACTSATTSRPQRGLAGARVPRCGVGGRCAHRPATRAVTVRADFGNGDRALRPGMLLDVALLRPQRRALVLPELAVVQVGASPSCTG
jgi:membrane fusion protein (multidrug efflux system)